MPQPPRTKIAKLRRSTCPQGRTLGFSSPDGGHTGRRRLQFFRPDQVPAFAGHVGWFECELVRGSARIARVVRQVAAPSWEDALSECPHLVEKPLNLGHSTSVIAASRR